MRNSLWSLALSRMNNERMTESQFANRTERDLSQGPRWLEVRAVTIAEEMTVHSGKTKQFNTFL